MFPKIAPVRVLACQPPRTEGPYSVPQSLSVVLGWGFEGSDFRAVLWTKFEVWVVGVQASPYGV